MCASCKDSGETAHCAASPEFSLLVNETSHKIPWPGSILFCSLLYENCEIVEIMDSYARIGNWPLLNTHYSGKIMFFEKVHVRDCYGFSPLITFAGNIVQDSILQHQSAVHMLVYM